ncbi:hypothetical protein GCM10007933_37580 [Zoogloea oryzae]|uniref:Uncharacterized protein n=1 Tax=Zoogloea oryzae TaxID=310767 RepID=A0ABQ6FIJ2_9RHOO|nr:hypothetical protein [Zoogloea oryzae]GLT24282.1 hypothetical protein GCM10007933_37580 [Zoogloea oryzae]
MSATPKRIPQPILDADIETLRALSGIDGYTPHNPAYSLESAMAALQRMSEFETALIHAENAVAAARSALLNERSTVHKIALGAKDEAIVLFGPDSDQIVALGMKKKSDRNRPKRAAKGADKG